MMLRLINYVTEELAKVRRVRKKFLDEKAYVEAIVQLDTTLVAIKPVRIDRFAVENCSLP